MCLCGDYVDDWNATVEDNIAILNKIIAYKQDNMDKVTLLLGNHELSYLGHKCSGHKASLETQKILRDNIHLFDVIYISPNNNYIATHAGLTSNWCKALGEKFKIYLPYREINNLLHDFNRDLLEYLSIASYTSGGYGNLASCLWARPDDHKYNDINDAILNLRVTQVVGHTPIHDYIVNNKLDKGPDHMYYVDTFSTYNTGETIGKEDLLICNEERGIFFYRNKHNDYKEIK